MDFLSKKTTFDATIECFLTSNNDSYFSSLTGNKIILEN